MAADNVSWGEERVANELKLKLGIRVSPRTVGKYLSNGGPVWTPDLQDSRSRGTPTFRTALGKEAA